jgi:hypothetical protein
MRSLLSRIQPFFRQAYMDRAVLTPEAGGLSPDGATGALAPIYPLVPVVQYFA